MNWHKNSRKAPKQSNKKSGYSANSELYITGYVLDDATGKLKPYKRKIKSGT